MNLVRVEERHVSFGHEGFEKIRVCRIAVSERLRASSRYPHSKDNSPSPEKPVTQTLSPDEPPPARAESEFKTDFSKHTVPCSEILSGGPPKDGIPALNEPQFVSVSEADQWLKPLEPVILVQVRDEAKAYPIQILIWHEIANDTVGGEPLVVTFCPLCNTAIAFKRTVNGQVLDFGTTGRLRYSNLIMYDRQTETWWQQATGEAIAGELTGSQLEFYPATIISWDDFKMSYPLDGYDGIARDTYYLYRPDAVWKLTPSPLVGLGRTMYAERQTTGAENTRFVGEVNAVTLLPYFLRLLRDWPRPELVF